MKSPQQTGWEMNEPGGTGTKGLRLVPTTRGARGPPRTAGHAWGRMQMRACKWVIPEDALGDELSV